MVAVDEPLCLRVLHLPQRVDALLAGDVLILGGYELPSDGVIRIILIHYGEYIVGNEHGEAWTCLPPFLFIFFQCQYF